MLADKESMSKAWDYLAQTIELEDGTFLAQRESWDKLLSEMGVDPEALHEISNHYALGMSSPMMMMQLMQNTKPEGFLISLLYNAFRQGFTIGVGSMLGKEINGSS